MQLRLATLVCALAVTSTAGAQPVDTFAELARQIELGEAVTVTLDRGRVVGQALDITPTSLTLMSAGTRLELDEAAVTRVQQRWDDPLQDGIWRGFLWGSIPPTVFFLWFVKEDGLVPADTIARGLSVTVGVAGGLGAWFGALTDAGKRAQRDIYRRPATQVRVSPLLSGERLGAAVAVSW